MSKRQSKLSKLYIIQYRYGFGSHWTYNNKGRWSSDDGRWIGKMLRTDLQRIQNPLQKTFALEDMVEIHVLVKPDGTATEVDLD